ncbi:MAG TPA: epimerase, partial [Rhodobacteraceae bacterium]|nr:epimerase [Paracoccaceae bacterium]
QQPKFRHVPVALLDIIIMMLGVAGLFSAGARAKRELARIGRYYATESMLVFDATTARYSADMTPAFGETRLNDFYQALVAGETEVELGEHAVF